ncbi:sigma-70 family RNA polymerase sigma factor [Paramicrobacterium agarici]|uniref:sigma-70 family RNA polymerase sigma factor n=1 Tax=Paramicrobacterium agarici TaxID=630514 RepID=UPI001154B453|nr:sigma-70 family RNA polymerase sigma factor [Microbacterium agarici]
MNPTERFERERPRLRAAAYRMLGSLAEADDAVQDAWLRLNASDTTDIRNLGAWLMTATSRVCLNMLRTRRTRGETALDARMPDPIVVSSTADPELSAEQGEAVSMALMVVMETLSPTERVAFVLHDMFTVPFDEIATLVEKTPDAVRQLASRARRRVRTRETQGHADAAEQRRVVRAFFAASRDGDIDGLLAVLAPDVVLRSDGGARRREQSVVLEGAQTVASKAAMYMELAPHVRFVSINGAEGAAVVVQGRVVSLMSFTVVDDRVVAIDVLADPERLPGVTRSITE